MGSTFNFDLYADKYDDFYRSDFGIYIDALEKEEISKHLKLHNKKYPILEIGSGSGHWSKWLSNNNFSVHGIDVSPMMIDRSLVKNIKNAQFELMDAQKLSFRNDTFENAIAITSIEFCSDRKKAISEIKRVLKPGGIFTLATLNSKSKIILSKDKNSLYSKAMLYSKTQLINDLSEFTLLKYSDVVPGDNNSLNSLSLNKDIIMLIATVKKQ